MKEQQEASKNLAAAVASFFFFNQNWMEKRQKQKTELKAFLGWLHVFGWLSTLDFIMVVHWVMSLPSCLLPHHELLSQVLVCDWTRQTIKLRLMPLYWGWAAFHRLMPALRRPCDVSWSSSRCAFQKSALLSFPVTSPSSKTHQLHHLVGLLGYQSEQSHQPPPSTGQTLLNQKFFLVKSEQKLLSAKT